MTSLCTDVYPSASIRFQSLLGPEILLHRDFGLYVSTLLGARFGVPPATFEVWRVVTDPTAPLASFLVVVCDALATNAVVTALRGDLQLHPRCPNAPGQGSMPVFCDVIRAFNVSWVDAVATAPYLSTADLSHFPPASLPSSEISLLAIALSASFVGACLITALCVVLASCTLTATRGRRRRSPGPGDLRKSAAALGGSPKEGTRPMRSDASSPPAAPPTAALHRAALHWSADPLDRVAARRAGALPQPSASDGSPSATGVDEAARTLSAMPSLWDIHAGRTALRADAQASQTSPPTTAGRIFTARLRSLLHGRLEAPVAVLPPPLPGRSVLPQAFGSSVGPDPKSYAGHFEPVAASAVAQSLGGDRGVAEAATAGMHQRSPAASTMSVSCVDSVSQSSCSAPNLRYHAMHPQAYSALSSASDDPRHSGLGSTESQQRSTKHTKHSTHRGAATSRTSRVQSLAPTKRLPPADEEVPPAPPAPFRSTCARQKLPY